MARRTLSFLTSSGPISTVPWRLKLLDRSRATNVNVEPDCINDFPFEFTFLDGPAIGRLLDAASVSQEILSVGADTTSEAADPSLTFGLLIANVKPTASQVLISGTLANEGDIAIDSSNLEWSEVVLSLSGTAITLDTWTLSVQVDPDTTVVFDYNVRADNRALSKIVGQWADDINGIGINGLITLIPSNKTLSGSLFAESFVDILGNAKLRITAKGDSTWFQVEVNTAGTGGVKATGTPRQSAGADSGMLYDKIVYKDKVADILRKWRVVAFEVMEIAVPEIDDPGQVCRNTGSSRTRLAARSPRRRTTALPTT